MPWTLVTGASKGIGAEIALALAKEGHNVVIHYRSNKEQAQKVAKSCQKYNVAAEIIQGNFSSMDNLQCFFNDYFQNYSDTAYLVNNVGPVVNLSPLNASVAIWNEIYQTNLTAPLFLIQNLKDAIIAHAGGIVNIGIAGLHANRAAVNIAPYWSAKLALLHLTKALAVELAPYNVNVNMVSPGYVEESMIHPSSISKIPAGRYATPAEIARGVAFFFSSKSTYITGQNLEISGALAL